jgi:hypothetical protein
LRKGGRLWVPSDRIGLNMHAWIPPFSHLSSPDGLIEVSVSLLSMYSRNHSFGNNLVIRQFAGEWQWTWTMLKFWAF